MMLINFVRMKTSIIVVVLFLQIICIPTISQQLPVRHVAIGINGGLRTFSGTFGFDAGWNFCRYFQMHGAFGINSNYGSILTGGTRFFLPMGEKLDLLAGVGYGTTPKDNYLVYSEPNGEAYILGRCKFIFYEFGLRMNGKRAVCITAGYRDRMNNVAILFDPNNTTDRNLPKLKHSITDGLTIGLGCYLQFNFNELERIKD